MKRFYPDYKNSILNVSNSFLKHYNVPSKYPTIPELDQELTKNYNHIIYILLDGMGVNVINEHLNEEDALRKHIKKEITSVFPPTTVAATDAVLSGLPPISNGHLGWSQYFKDEDIHMVVFRNVNYYTEELYPVNLREKYLSFDRLPDLVHRHNPDIITNEFFPSFIPGGSESFKEEIEKVLVVTHNTDQSFSYLYWTEPDMSQHIYGPYSNEVKQVMKNLNNDFTELIENMNDDTLVVCIADHGLTNVEEIPLYEYTDLMDLLDKKPSLEPRTTTFFVKGGKLDIFKDTFNKHFGDKFDLYTKQEILDMKLFGDGEYHPKSLEFIGDYTSIAKDKYMFIFNVSNNYKGHHAGLTKDEMIVPLIMYSK